MERRRLGGETAAVEAAVVLSIQETKQEIAPLDAAPRRLRAGATSVPASKLMWLCSVHSRNKTIRVQWSATDSARETAAVEAAVVLFIQETKQNWAG
jgi:hypothetical protein